MLPRCPTNDMAKRPPRNLIFCGNVFPCVIFNRAAMPNCDNFGFGQDSSSIRMAAHFGQSHPQGMMGILFGGNVFKIFKAIVSLVSVLVIDLMTRWARWHERFCDNGMDCICVARLAIAGKGNKLITWTMRMDSQNPWRKRSLPRGISSHSPHVRYRIPSLVPNDRLPDFGYALLRHDDLLSESSCLGSRGVTAPRRSALYGETLRRQDEKTRHFKRHAHSDRDSVFVEYIRSKAAQATGDSNNGR